MQSLLFALSMKFWSHSAEWSVGAHSVSSAMSEAQTSINTFWRSENAVHMASVLARKMSHILWGFREIAKVQVTDSGWRRMTWTRTEIRARQRPTRSGPGARSLADVTGAWLTASPSSYSSTRAQSVSCCRISAQRCWSPECSV